MKLIKMTVIKNLSVSADVKAIISRVLIKYLWELALYEDWRNDEKQSFVLEAGKLGGRDIQDIHHFHDNGNLIASHRIYGVEPVNCEIEIVDSRTIYQMKKL